MEKQQREEEEWRKSIEKQRNGERAKRRRGMEKDQREAEEWRMSKEEKGMEKEQR